MPRKYGPHVDIGAFELPPASLPVRLAACSRAANGVIQMTLTNIPGASLTVLAATNPALPLSAWAVLGGVPEITAGQFQFADSGATNLAQRFYRLRSP
jgi:hypothetical protein